MSGASMTETEFSNLSDDDILNMVEAPVVESSGNMGDADEVHDPDLDIEGTGGVAAGDAAASGDAGDGDPDEAAAADPVAPGSPEEVLGGVDPLGADDASLADQTLGSSQAKDPAPAGEAKPPKKDGTETKAEDAKVEDTQPVNYEAAYKKIMAPFKAAGKTVQLKSEDDVIQLMQMGAHYTKKMQALQPGLKLLRMLENNKLLDEGKLSFLIDVSRKDPSAIQKLVRESGIDPIDIDTTAEPTYQPGNHKVSDEEMTFTDLIEEVAADNTGKELILNINKTWDQTSKEALWGDPNILRILSTQKQTGIYDQIVGEIDRRKTLGYLRNEPFLQAYKTVGEEMQAQGKLTPTSTNQDPKPEEGQSEPGGRILETRPAQRKTVSNSEQAKAASPTRAASRKAAPVDFNPLSLSDEEFEKRVGVGSRL